MKTAALVTLAAALAAGACAPTASTQDGGGSGRSARTCFYADQVRNFQNGPTGTVYVRSLRNDVFELTAAGTCQDIDNANVLGLSAWGAGPSRLCPGDWATAHIPDVRPSAAPCQVRVVKALSPAEVEALDPRYRP